LQTSVLGETEVLWMPNRRTCRISRKKRWAKGRNYQPAKGHLGKDFNWVGVKILIIAPSRRVFKS